MNRVNMAIFFGVIFVAAVIHSGWAINCNFCEVLYEESGPTNGTTTIVPGPAAPECDDPAAPQGKSVDCATVDKEYPSHATVFSYVISTVPEDFIYDSCVIVHSKECQITRNSSVVMTVSGTNHKCSKKKLASGKEFCETVIEGLKTGYKCTQVECKICDKDGCNVDVTSTTVSHGPNTTISHKASSHHDKTSARHLTTKPNTKATKGLSDKVRPPAMVTYLLILVVVSILTYCLLVTY